MVFCVLFALFLTLNTYADPVAIGGTGTVTLNYENTSNPTAPAANTYVMSKLSTKIKDETCIAFGQTNWESWDRIYNSVDWSVTIEPGIYDVELSYGTASWGTQPLFAIYDGETKVQDIYLDSNTSGGAWASQEDRSTIVEGLNLGTLSGSKTYTIRVTETSTSYGLCVGHIGFTRATKYTAKWGYKTGTYAYDDGMFSSEPNVPSTENGISVISNMSYTSGTSDNYTYHFGSSSYIDIYVGAGRVITEIATSVLCDGTNDGAELQISFSPSTPFNTNDASTPATFKSNGWTNYASTNNPAMTSISIPQGTWKSARITKSASATHGNYLYRLKVVAEDAGGDSGDEHTVYFESSNNNYGTVDVASISSVPDASTVSIDNNVLTLNGTDVTATPVSATAEYTYAFSNWSVSDGAEITENQTITANFTRTANSYTLTWNLDGGTVTTAGTGAAVDATGTPSSSVAYGTAITAPIVSKAGVEFIGWNSDPASTMPAANTTYIAQWQSVPTVTNLNTSVDDDDVTVSWTNYNKLDLIDNVAIEGFKDGAKSTMSFTISNGNILDVDYDIKEDWGYRSVEIRLQREMNHVTSIDLDYIYNNAYAYNPDGPEGPEIGGLIPYMMYDGTETSPETWNTYYKSYTAYNVTSYTNFNLTPVHILWQGSGNYDSNRKIHKVGFTMNPPLVSTGTFSVKDICINTSDNQTTLDEIIVIRKKGSAPTSISDGTQVYSGVLNTFMDNNLANGKYYYAVYARRGSNYSVAATTGPVQIGPDTYDLSLHQPSKYETAAPDGYGRTLKTVGDYQYEVYRFAYVNDKGALYAGSESTVTNGYALITNATSSESVGDGWVAVKPYSYVNSSYTIDAEFAGSCIFPRFGNSDYLRLYVQGYDQFSFAGRDDSDNNTGYFKVKIDGVEQDYTINRANHITRYSLTANEPHIIEILGANSDYHNRLFGFSLRLPVDDTPRSVTYAKGNVAVTGDLPSNTSYAPETEVTLPEKGNLAWTGHVFIGWSDGSNRYAAGETYTMPAHDVTFTAQWAEIHQPGKYETATASGGYGRSLQIYNNREYEVYEVAVAESKGALYAGPAAEVTDGYQVFNNATNATEIIGDNWVYVKARDYNAYIRAFGNEFGQLNSEGTLSPQSARLDNVSYVRLYVQGYDQFTFIGIDSYENTPNNYFVIKIDGVTQSYTPDADHYNYTRYDLDESIAHVIEVTANSSDYHNRFFGFSLRLPADDTQRSVTYAKGNEAVTGDLPASGSYVWGETFDLPAQGTLSWAEHYFIGWNDGTATYAPGYTYTMPRQAVTFTAQWLAPEYIPTTTSLNSTNVYVSPGTVEFNVDGEGDAEECINIAGKQTAEWKVYFTRGIYKLNMPYGTTGGGVNVTFKIFDGDTELTAYTKNDSHNDGSGVHLYNAKWDLDLRTIDENKLYTVKVIDTWGDTSSKPRVGSLNFSIVSPIVLSDTPVQLTHENVTFSPGTYDMDVDGIDGDETCVDIRDQQKADWLVQITPGYYQISMLYGTPGGTVKVQVMIIDAETGEPIEGKVTTEDIHYSGSSFLAKWGMDLRTGIDENKTYFVRVKDVFGGDGSKPEVAYINMVSVDPITVSNSVKTKLDHNNVTTPYTIEPFDIEDNGSNETCLFIGDNNKADWLVKIAPITYNIRVRYGRTTGTRLTLYIIDGSNHVVWNSDTRPTPSGRYEVWEINGIDLSDKVNATDEYIIRIKDDYDGTGSKPYIEYIEFIPKVTHTRTNLRAGDYGTICLPYAVAAADRNGAELFELEQWADNGASLTISQLNADDDMEAGKPYIFQATANTATFSYYPEGDAAEAQTYNGLIGKYEEMEIPMNDDNYIIYNNKLYLVNSANIWVGANRAYIHKGGAPMNQAPANRRRVTLGVYGTQTATGFDPVTGNPSSVTLKYIENGHLFIIRDGKTYNAQGQVVK